MLNFKPYYEKRYFVVKNGERMKEIKTDKAPLPLGPYSQAIETENLIFISGQIGIAPKTSEMQEGIEEQTKQIFKNIKAILDTSDLTFNKIVKTTIFLKNLNDFSTVNEIYSQHFSEPFPARSCVGVANLPAGALIEIELIGALR
jgi:2-iminobutanoate/2-iminopropanoate deaminase